MEFEQGGRKGAGCEHRGETGQGKTSVWSAGRRDGLEDAVSWEQPGSKLTCLNRAPFLLRMRISPGWL